ncbi:uncharacterized protein BDR25DRAFT_354983 [Lindgomyces ingoldianus]|uniref:Uncharacterized protein n=1 Tax=Lindgomyces ingoldianus TaxID=673940 RepID=A0ACB6QVV8_9PLEO|nr:uncharacterized protein BDR25DRAFT_354983 [Lindgomyces ingoldianus]KAF2471061.1 hypothetical protein BDR25DRAFT_354983 [Lindgomyces ingoldianus]
MTLDPGTDPLRGGTITVDGITFIVPKNTLVTLPAAVAAWPELFNGETPIMPGTQTYQAIVQGNHAADKNIAGLVYLHQNFLRALQGFITEINPVNGHFKVAGAFSPAGQLECVINDPLGIYGPKYTANPLWSVDPSNPSIHAATGFPMCIPRSANDELCPMKNRPLDGAGRPLTRFTFSDPATIGPTDPDAMVMAPLMVGDYITFSGQLIDNLFEVSSLTADIGFYTAPGTKPAFITVEEAQFGIRFPVTGGELPETRAVAFTTDPTTSVQWYAEERHPCTGNITERNLQLVQPQTAAPRGRVRFRLGTTDPGDSVRNFGFRMTNGVITTKNNLTGGLFIQPIGDFIFPEQGILGADLSPLAFETMSFLTQGYGPYVPGNVLTPPPATPVLVGQLFPWPGLGDGPLAVNCATEPTPTVSPTPTPTPTPPPVDFITIISATKLKNRGGGFIVEVRAKSDNPAAKLSISVSALVRPLNNAPMARDPDGTFFTKVLTKGQPLGVTVTSDFGGSSSTVPL